MKESMISQVYSIGKEAVAAKCPTEVGLFDLIWEQLKDGLKDWKESDPNKWVLSRQMEQVPGLGLLGPEAFRLSTPRIIALIAAVLTSLAHHEIYNPDDMRKLILLDLKKYAEMFSVPPHLVKYLERTLPSLLIEIPGDIADTEVCWKLLSKGRKEKISIKEARLLPRKDRDYIVFINMLHRKRPVLYIDNVMLSVRAMGVKLLVALLRKEGNVCSYSEIIESLWGKLIEKLPQSEEDRYIERVERTINTTLRSTSMLLKTNVVNVPAVGYKVEGNLLRYCILERYGDQDF